MKTPIVLKPNRIQKVSFLTLSLLAASTLAGLSADRSWTGGTASYTNAANWTGSTVPGAVDNAINDNGTGNAVQINIGDPDWTVGQIRAGNSVGNGAYVQNGQTVTTLGTNYNGPVISEFFSPFRLGIVAADTGVYTINGGTLNYGPGEFHIGEVGAGIMNINGGTVTGNGQFRVNNGGIAVPNPAVLTATAGHGPYLGDYTYFEQGYSPSNPTKGLPPAGTTIFSVTQGDHSYTLAPSYTNNNAVILDAAVPTATITLTTPTPLTGLSFMGSAGNGPVTNICVVHFASGAPETNVVIIADWFGSGNEVLNVEGRVDGLGKDFQFPGPAGGNPIGNAPYLLSTDIALVNTANVTSIDLTFAGGNGNSFATATIMAVSGQTVVSGSFDPLAISGYNADVVIGATAPSPIVSNSITDVLNQSGGALNINNQMFVGYIGNGVYNLTGGTNTCNDWIVIGRTGGKGTLNMSGGVINHASGGQPAMVIASRDGAANSIGTFNQSAGTVNCNSEFWVGQDVGSIGTNNLSGNAMLNVNSWVAIGRAGGNGTLTISGNATFNKTTSGNTGNFIVADNSVGHVIQTGGTNFIAGGDLWIGQGTGNGGGNGTYDLSGGVVTIDNGYLAVGREGGTGVLNISGGSMVKQGGGNISLGHNAPGNATINQTAGSFTCVSGETYIGENAATATWTISGGTATFGVVRIPLNADAAGTVYLNGGTFTANEISAPNGGSGAFNFNGGTLRAGVATTTFMHDLPAAYVQAGGAIIDSQGFDITLAQNLQDGGGGGLTKIGSGRLTLSGANSYSGNTVINAGTLLVPTTASTGSSLFSVANGAAFSVQVAGSLNSQFTAGNLSLNTSTLNFDLGGFGTPTTPPLNLIGTVTLNGSTTVNIASGAPIPVGAVPLIQYTGTSGVGSFTLGTLPPGEVGVLSNSASGLYLVITSAGAPRWNGDINSAWDTTTANWIDQITSGATTYHNGSPVLFDDNAVNSTVTLGIGVTPGSVTFNNNSLSYTLNGAGSINGSIGLQKQGAASVTIVNNNGYTGPTTISGGTLIVSNLANGGSSSPIGASTANPTNLVLAGGTLSYAGPTITVNRGYTIQTGGGTIETVGNLALSGLATVVPNAGFTKTGAAQLAYTGVGANALSGSGSSGYGVRDGTVVFDGSAGPQTNIVQGTFSVAGVVNAAATLTNATLNVNDNAVGNVASSFGSMTMGGSSTLNVNSWLTLGDAANSVSTFTLNSGIVNVPNGRLFLCSAPGTMATLNINGGVINKNSGDIICIADGGWNGSGARTGVVNQVAGTVNCSPDIQIGQTALGTGIWNLHGGALNNSGWFVIGRAGGNGTMNIDGGVLTHTSGGQPAFIVGSGAGNNSLASVGVLNQSAGTINCTSEYWVGENTLSVGTNNISGSAAVNVANWVSLGRGGQATVNFSGGTFAKTGNGNFIIGDGGTAVLNQSGTATLTINSEFWIGQSGSGNGTYNMSGGTNTVGSWVAVGRGGTGVWNMSGGSFTKTGNSGNHMTIASGGPGTINQTGGTITSTLSSTFIGEGTQPAVWNMNGGSTFLSLVNLPINNNANGTLNLNGGTFSATEITTGNAGGKGTLNFNGGTLVAASGASANFLHDISTNNVLAGGAVIDSGANTISIPQPFLDAGGSGGLTKVGNGTLYLNGVNTYTGSTLVSTGALGGSGTIAGPVSVAAGATLAPGTASIGTLTINNNLTLAGSSKTFVKVSLNGGVTNSDQVVGLTSVTYAGALTVSNVGTNVLTVGSQFQLFTAGAFSGNYSSVAILPFGTGTFNPATGKLTITSMVPPVVNPPVTSGGNLILSGTGGTPGGAYTWLTTTNLLNPIGTWTVGVSGVYNSVGAFTNAIPINPSSPAQFYRFRTP